VKTLLAVLLLSAIACGQASPSMPSREEISELVNKANEKIAAYEEAVKNAKPYLDKINPKFAENYLAASSTGHVIIEQILKKGPSAYGLVSLLATLDDMSLNAAMGSVQLLRTDEERVTKGGSPNANTLAAVILLNNASTACTDISELIMHATLRFVDTEEQMLAKSLDSQK
jgi:hypothetical protein